MNKTRLSNKTDNFQTNDTKIAALDGLTSLWTMEKNPEKPNIWSSDVLGRWIEKNIRQYWTEENC